VLAEVSLRLSGLVELVIAGYAPNGLTGRAWTNIAAVVDQLPQLATLRLPHTHLDGEALSSPQLCRDYAG
jgi:hypothetical protein